jgi:hypothetical protein
MHSYRWTLAAVAVLAAWLTAALTQYALSH